MTYQQCDNILHFAETIIQMVGVEEGILVAPFIKISLNGIFDSKRFSSDIY